MEEVKNQNGVYIKIHKSLCTQIESKYADRPNYNIMKLPKGTKVGQMELSYCVINPIVMFEDKKNPNYYVAKYDRTKLRDNAVSVFTGAEGDQRYVQIDVDELRKAVAAANHNYYEAHKASRAAKAEKKQDIAEEKPGYLKPLTAEGLKRDEALCDI